MRMDGQQPVGKMKTHRPGRLGAIIHESRSQHIFSTLVRGLARDNVEVRHQPLAVPSESSQAAFCRRGCGRNCMRSIQSISL